jgi:phosphatidylglycerol:prolipoprotein diacylglycerol transferase
VEAGCLFILFGLLLCIAFRFRGAVYLLGVGIIRFILEFFRGDVRGTIFGITIFSPQQILSVVFFVLGIILLQSSKSISQSEVPPV